MTKYLFQPTYRSEIDGLRAVAVLSVVAFHAFPTVVKGGFVGVDVFFVISGYLISTIIFQNLDKNAFSFREFYSRRIKRIFPALIIILATSYVLGWFTLLADEYKQLGKHIAGGSAFVSNFLLWKESGYFDNAAETKPLLHLWSLGVEEQFYIFYPMIIWIAWKKKINLFFVTMFIALISFYLNLNNILNHNAVSSFFLPQARFWELMCGSMLAWITLYAKDDFKKKLNESIAFLTSNRFEKINEIKLRNISASIGLIALFCCIFYIHKSQSFPGAWALLPVFSAVLIISAGNKALVNKYLLSNKIMVWFGLISFPLYLWHWVLLSFPRIVQGELPNATIRIMSVFFSIFLAWLTYRFIEYPIRFGRWKKKKTGVLLSIMMFLFCLGLLTDKQEGFVFRFALLAPNSQEKMIKIARAWNFRDYPKPEDAFDDSKFQGLRIGRNDEKIILFFGDSHSEQYWNSIPSLILNEKSKKGLDYSVIFYHWHQEKFPPLIDSAFLANPKIEKVIFSYYWSYRYKSKSVDQAVRCCGDGKNGSVGKSEPTNGDAEMDDLDQTFISMVKAIRSAGKEVYFILDNPFGEELDPHAMLERSWSGFFVKTPLKLNRDAALSRTEPVRSRILRIAKLTSSKVIDPFISLCNENFCPAFSEDGELLYKDYDHLSLFSSKYKANYLEEIFN